MASSKYLHPPEAIASYNFVDIASGTGYIEFYLGTTVDTNVISNITFYSDDILTSATITGDDTKTKILDLDFDVTINKPTIFQGRGIANIPIAIYHDDSDGTGYVIVKIRKYDGTTETDICNNTSTEIAVPGNPYGTTYKMTATDLTIPRTQFKKGETLRITIEGWAEANDPTAGVDPKFRIAHDPKGRTTGWSTDVSSIASILMPVVIDL